MSYNLKPSYPNIDALDTRDKAVSVIYGRTGGGTIVPISVDSSGRVVIGAPLILNTDNIDIGDVVIKGITDPSVVGVSPTVGEVRFGMHRVGDAAAVNPNLHTLLTWDPRMTFDGAGKLKVDTSVTIDSVDIGDVNIKGKDVLGGPDQYIYTVQNTDLSWALHTHDSRFTFTGGAVHTTTAGSGTIFAAVAANITSPAYDTYADVGTAFNVQGFNKKSFTLKNTGATACDIRGFASMDGGVTYDIPLLPPANLNAGGLVWIDDERAFTHFKFQVQRNVAGDTSVQIKGFAA